MNGESGFNFADERWSEDETIAYAQCMTKMAGGELNGDDIAALRRIYRGETTPEVEQAAYLTRQGITLDELRSGLRDAH